MSFCQSSSTLCGNYFNENKLTSINDALAQNYHTYLLILTATDTRDASTSKNKMRSSFSFILKKKKILSVAKKEEEEERNSSPQSTDVIFFAESGHK